MKLYRAYGLNILSDIDFYQKSNIKGIPDVNIISGKVANEFFKEIITGNNFWIGQNRSLNETLIKWDNIGKFIIQNGSKIIVDSETENKNLLDAYILGPVMATLLFQRGFLVLHGSAVETEYGVVAFLGPSGFGKSTIAAILNNEGYKVISDDILAIKINPGGDSYVFPGFPQLKLSSASIESIWENTQLELKTIDPDEHLIKIDHDYLDCMPLKKIYILKKASNSSIDGLETQKALMELFENSYCYIMFQDEDKITNLYQCVDLLKKTDLSLLNIQHSFQTVHDLVEIVVNDIVTK